MKVWLNLPARWSQFTTAHQFDFHIYYVYMIKHQYAIQKQLLWSNKKKVNAINPLLPSCAIKKEHSILWQLGFFEQNRGFNILWQLEEEEEAGSKGSSSIKQSRHNAAPLPPPHMPPTPPCRRYALLGGLPRLTVAALAAAAIRAARRCAPGEWRASR